MMQYFIYHWDGTLVLSVQKIVALSLQYYLHEYKGLAWSYSSQCRWQVLYYNSDFILNKQKCPLFHKDFSLPLLYLFQHHIVLKCIRIKGHSFSFQNISLWFMFPEVHIESTIDKRTSHTTLTYLWGISFRSTHFIRERLLQTIILLLITFSNH